jgi:hypothetical protein
VKWSREQALGEAGEAWFRHNLPRGWIPQKQTPDIGLDFLVTITEDEQIRNWQFGVQIKATEKPSFKDAGMELPDLRREWLASWMSSLTPILIVVYDAKNQRGYYAWVSDLLVGRDWQTMTQRTMSLTIPLSSVLDAEGWNRVRDHVLSHRAKMEGALASDRLMNHVRPAVARLSQSLQILQMVQANRKRGKEAMMLFGVSEMVAHRTVVEATNQLLGSLEPKSDLAQSLRAFVSEYCRLIETFTPNFSNLLSQEESALVWVNPEKQAKARPHLSLRVMELVQLLNQ